MWFGWTAPKKPRLTLRSCRQERLEVAGIVVCAYPFGWWLRLAFVVWLSAHGAILAVRSRGRSRPPNFASRSDVIPPLLQYFGEQFELGWEIRHVIACLFQLPSLPAGQHHGPRRSALCIRCERILEQDPLLSKLIDIGCLDPWRTIAARVLPPIVHNDVKDIGLSRRNYRGVQ
jgi:hypothetical protein